MAQELKDKINDTFQYVKDVASHSSLADIRKNVSDAIDGAKDLANEHIDEFQSLNSKVDPIADRLLEKAKESKYSPLYIAFLFMTGIAVGFGICSAI